MKKCAFILAFLLLVVKSFGQDVNNTIKLGFDAYNQAIADGEFSKALDFAPQNLFEIVSKEQMIKAMETTFNNPSLEFKIEKPVYQNLEKAKIIDGKYYAIISYISPISMKFKREEKQESEEDKKVTQNLIRMSLENTFGKDRVKLNESNGFFDIKADKKAIAISSDGETNWKYIVVEPKQAIMLQKLLPKSLLASLE